MTNIDTPTNILSSKVRYRSKLTGDEVLALQWVVTGDNSAEVSKFLKRSYASTPSMEFYMSEGESISVQPGDWVICSLTCKIGSPYLVASDFTFRKNYELIADEARDVSPLAIEGDL